MPPGYTVLNEGKPFHGMDYHIRLSVAANLIVKLLVALSEMIKTKWPVRTFG